MGLDQFRRLRDWWKGRVIVKGVLDPRDAVALVDAGADGIWVSNHGGANWTARLRALMRCPRSMPPWARECP